MLTAMTLNVSAQEQTDSTDKSLVPVAFGKTAIEETLGGVSVVNVRELTEKNYNTYALDNMQGYIGGWNGNSLWGMDDRLILIDGVPRDINNVKPDEIETITFMKGAQAVVLYGSRAAKGVILVTTKRGKESPLKVEVRANTGWNVAKSFPEYLGSAEYMTLYNEARANDGLAPLYTAEQIYNYGSGLNPYRYPSVDFYSSDYVKKAFNRSELTAEITGGNRVAQYYTNIGFYRQGDYLNFGEAENNYTQRFNIRGNVDFRLNDMITAYVNATASFYDQKSPVGGNYWEAATQLRPNRVSPLIPMSYLDPNAVAAHTLLGATDNIFGGMFLGGTQADLTNVFASYYAAGRSKWTSRQFQFDTGINFDLGSLLKGLSFHTQFAVDYATSYSTSYNNDYATYEPIWSNYGGRDVITGLVKYNDDKKSGVQNISGSTSNQVMSFNAYFNYDRTFADVHHVNAKLVANGFQLTESGQYHKTSNANLGLQMAYNYDHKYYADFSVAAIHSSKLAEGHREALSPSLSLGWDLAKEKFLQGSAFDNLLLSVSGSILNTDLGIDNYYMYAGYYDEIYGGAWYDDQTTQSFISKRGSNEGLSFLKRKEFSVNLKTSLWKKMITADLSFFVNSIEGKIIDDRSSYPLYFFTYWPEANFLAYKNNDNDRRIGFDFALNYHQNFGDFDFSAGVTGTYYNTKATKRNDVDYADAYQHRQGRPLDAIWGYECLGFFKDQEDIDNSPSQSELSGNIAPGDLKYKDQNNDGVINRYDMINLGRGGWYGNPFTLGINLTGKYKGFTLFVLATGGFGCYGMKSGSYWRISGEDKYSAVVRGRWTPETAETATYPRLTTGDGNNNNVDSNFWLYKTDRFDLAKVQLTYDFPSKLFRDSYWVSGLSAYVSGNSLLTIAKERKLMEMSVGSTPQSRFYNVGVKVTF